LIGDDTCYQLEDLTCEQVCTQSIWSQELDKQFIGGHCSSRQCGHLKNNAPRAGGTTGDCELQEKTCCCDVEYTNLKICPEEWIKDQTGFTMLHTPISKGEEIIEPVRWEDEYFMINGEKVPGLYVDTEWVENNCDIEPTIIPCDLVCESEEQCVGSCADSNITKLASDYGVFDL